MTAATLATLPSNISSGGPLTSEHRRELARARQTSKAVRKAARIAAFNGWATAAVAALSAPFALFSLTGLLMLTGLSLVAYNELRGRRRLLRFDPRAAAILGWNQLGLLAMIVVYCLWTIHASLNGANSLSAELQAYAGSAFGSTHEFVALARQVVVAIYGSIIALSILFQGLNALYYFTRRRHIDAYLAETPEWIRELQAAS